LPVHVLQQLQQSIAAVLHVCFMLRGVEKLIAATGRLMVDVGTVDGHTPLHVAAVNGLRQIAQVLVETVSCQFD